MAGTQLLKTLARRHRAVRARGEHDAAPRPPSERVPAAHTAAALSAWRQAAVLLALVDPDGEPDPRAFGPCSSSED